MTPWAPEKQEKEVPIEKTKESEAGIGYRGANGSHIKNYGESEIIGRMKDGQGVSMKMVVADVTKVLASVARMCERGNRVVFDDKGSYVECKRDGHRTRMEKRNGVYVMDMWIRKPRGANGASEQEEERTFARLGAEMIWISGL